MHISLLTMLTPPIFSLSVFNADTFSGCQPTSKMPIAWNK